MIVSICFADDDKTLERLKGEVINWHDAANRTRDEADALKVTTEE